MPPINEPIPGGGPRYDRRHLGEYAPPHVDEQWVPYTGPYQGPRKILLPDPDEEDCRILPVDTPPDPRPHPIKTREIEFVPVRSRRRAAPVKAAPVEAAPVEESEPRRRRRRFRRNRK